VIHFFGCFQQLSDASPILRFNKNNWLQKLHAHY